MMGELTITSERVREAAETYPDAARVLEKLFPAAFLPENLIVKKGDRVRNG